MLRRFSGGGGGGGGEGGEGGEGGGGGGGGEENILTPTEIKPTHKAIVTTATFVTNLCLSLFHFSRLNGCVKNIDQHSPYCNYVIIILLFSCLWLCLE